MKQFITYLFLLLPLSFLFGADISEGSSGVSPYAYEIGKIFNLPLTNAILTTWVVSIVFIIAVRFAVGKPNLIPNKAQSVIETLIEGLKGLLEPILGKQAFQQAFPLLLGFFVFILILIGVDCFQELGCLGFMMNPGI